MNPGANQASSSKDSQFDIHHGDQATNGVDVEHCTICLEPFVDRTVIPTCAHQFCFECVFIWSCRSRRCPLCSQQFGDHLIHHIRSNHDYTKHYLLPLTTSPAPSTSSSRPQYRPSVPRRIAPKWGRRILREAEDADELERAVARRRWIYRHNLYAKHVASNRYTRYRPYPSPAHFASSPILIARMTTFLRRELRVWVNLDVEFFTTYLISIMKKIDIRSQPAVQLLADMLEDTEDGCATAEHLAHEIYSFIRSPFSDLSVYDSVVQYDTPQTCAAPGARTGTHPSQLCS